MGRKLPNTWCSSTACRWEFKVNTFANSKVANASQCPCVHVCSQRVWECKSRNAVTLKQPPLDTVATIQLSLWWEDENKEKSDDKYKLRARLCRLSSFKLILRIVCLFVQFVCFLAIQIRLMAWLGFDLAGSVVYRGGRDRLLGLLASWACHKRSQVAMAVVEPD